MTIPRRTRELSGQPHDEFPSLFQIIVECRDEEEQRALYERLAAEGFECRVVSL